MEILLILIVVCIVGIFGRRFYMLGERLSSTRIKPITEQESREMEKESHFKKMKRFIHKGAHKFAPKTLEAKILYSRAMKYYEKGDMEEAEKKLIQVTALDENYNDAFHKLGLIYLKQNQFGRAEAVFKQLVYNVENDPVYYSNLGRALYEQKKYDEALEAYLKALELDSTRPGRFISTAEVYRQLNNKEKAFEMYKKAIEMDAGNIDYLLTFANFLIEDNKIEQAKETLQQVLEKEPENEMALEMMKEIEKK
jgi:tetratricopeptide (TPR) repeat protein